MSAALCGANLKKKIVQIGKFTVRLALEIRDTRLGIEQLNVPGGQAAMESGWNLFNVASLPGTTDVAIDPTSGRLDVAWTSNSEATDDKDTMILVHTSQVAVPGFGDAGELLEAEALWRPTKLTSLISVTSR